MSTTPTTTAAITAVRAALCIAAQQVLEATELRCARLEAAITPGAPPMCVASMKETTARWRAEAAQTAAALTQQPQAAATFTSLPVAVLDDRGTIQYMNLAPEQTFYFVDRPWHGQRLFRTVTAYIADDIHESVLLEITGLASGATYTVTVPNDTRVLHLPL